MKLTTITFSIFVALLMACTPKEQEEKNNKSKLKTQNQAQAQAQAISSIGTSDSRRSADIVIPANKELPMDKRGGEFTLYGKQGAVNLSDYKGKVVAIYFGYMQCPDICPTNLALMGAAFKKLSKKELESTQGIFISVDPGRDTPELLAGYTKYFHKKIIGVSGTPETIDPIVVAYGAFYEKVSYSNSAMLYGVSHTSETYIVGKDGKLSAILPHAASVNTIIKSIQLAQAAN